MTINIDKNELIEFVTDYWIKHKGYTPTDPECFWKIIDKHYDLYGNFVDWDGGALFDTPHIPEPMVKKLSRDIFDEAVEVIKRKVKAVLEQQKQAENQEKG